MIKLLIAVKHISQDAVYEGRVVLIRYQERFKSKRLRKLDAKKILNCLTSLISKEFKLLQEENIF